MFTHQRKDQASAQAPAAEPRQAARGFGSNSERAQALGARRAPPPASPRALGRADQQRLRALASREGIDSAPALEARIAAIASLLSRAGDQRGLFPVVYARITERARASLDESAYRDPAWAERLIVAFGHRYLDNLAAHLDGRAPTPAWERYYALAAQGDVPVETLAQAITAHLVDDLPRSLADVDSGPAQRDDFMHFGELLLESFSALVDDVRRAYGVDAEPLLSGLAPGKWMDQALGPKTASRLIFQGIRQKAWMMSQRLADPRWAGSANFEIKASLAAIETALCGLEKAGAL